MPEGGSAQEGERCAHCTSDTAPQFVLEVGDLSPSDVHSRSLEDRPVGTGHDTEQRVHERVERADSPRCS